MPPAEPPVTLPHPLAVIARAPAKVNVYLGVGGAGDDGFHELATVFMGLSLYEDVAAWPADALEVTLNTASAGVRVDRVPLDESNIVAQAAQLMATTIGREPHVHLQITKRVPVAAGMAGGSADAAAALVALNALWQANLSDAELRDLGAQLGSDVPFGLTGGVALGAGRGDHLTSVLAPDAVYHWVLAVSTEALSTPAVYGEFDRLYPDVNQVPSVPDTLLSAMRTADPERVGALLANDLQAPAVSLLPSLQDVIDAGRRAGACGVIVSGSGPTVAMLARDREHAIELTVTLAATSGIKVLERARGPVAGARIVTP